MTAALMLKACMSIAAALPEFERSTFDLLESQYGENMSTMNDAGAQLARLCRALRADIAADTARKNGKAVSYAAAKRICKSTLGQYRTEYAGAWLDSEGRQCMISGARAVRINEPFDALPPAPSYKPREIDLESLLRPARENLIPLEVPDLKKLRADLKIHKAEQQAVKVSFRKPLFYRFGEGLPTVDARLLLDMFELFPDASVTASKYRPETAALHFQSKSGEGLLMPIRAEKAAQKGEAHA